jgi:glutamine amidotransferase
LSALHLGTDAQTLPAVDEHYLPELKKHYARDRASDDGLSPNPLTNVDGFGIGWFSSVPAKYRAAAATSEGGSDWEPVLYKNTMPPRHDPNLVNCCRAIESPVVFGHIRDVSTCFHELEGKDRSLFRRGQGSPVALTNCHPYTAGNVVLMHNGTIGGGFRSSL